MKVKFNAKTLLVVLLITFILFDIRLPKFVEQFLQSLFGKVLLFLSAVALYTQGPLVGSLALVAAYVVLVRTSSILPVNTSSFIPTQKKKEKFFRNTLNNHFPKTLEETMVKNMVPLVKDEPVINGNFVPSFDRTYDAGKF